MGAEVEYLMEKVNPKMDPKWLITCDTHAEGTAISRGMDTTLASGMMTYQNCSLREGKTVGTYGKECAFMDKAGVDSISAGIIFPGVGAPKVHKLWSPKMDKSQSGLKSLLR